MVCLDVLMSVTKHISIRIPEEILLMVDEQAQRMRWSRNATLNTCIEFGLPDLELARSGRWIDAEIKSKATSEKVGEAGPENRSAGIKGVATGGKGGGTRSPKAAEVMVKDWFPVSKCPHDYVNSFVCEKNNGGCKR